MPQMKSNRCQRFSRAYEIFHIQRVHGFRRYERNSREQTWRNDFFATFSADISTKFSNFGHEWYHKRIPTLCRSNSIDLILFWFNFSPLNLSVSDQKSISQKYFFLLYRESNARRKCLKIFRKFWGKIQFWVGSFS